MGENTLYLDFPGNEVKPIFGWDQVCTIEWITFSLTHKSDTRRLEVLADLKNMYLLLIRPKSPPFSAFKTKILLCMV